ncbi:MULTISPECIES: hypothetical protein [Mycobacteroides]|nr:MULTISPECIES: hypothetical protein [Mycobacteroides]KRQ25428.1 hypothetical protein AOT87_09705 [Mycobacteroides sp. H003]KRQ31890.1 hypothetical protein AOT91_12390 [Mycobacteroides sp. H092]KRQ34902.1 hypothetical protein AOT92_25550 [Mycobacteroides sp. H101]KRQ53289.1 hypothetical protein AOT88_01805 [Mycobacteroides sp. H063]KRQ60383.1 hypothetical protein AOT90_19230 [Mycobacteroides sp. H079]
MTALIFRYYRNLATRLFRRHPLIRGSDRLDAAVQVLGWLTAIAMISVAGAFGTAMYDAERRNISDQQLSRHQVQAIAVGVGSVVEHRYNTVVLIPAAWDHAGVRHRDTVRYGKELNVGDRFSIWVDQSGRHVQAPMAPESAVTDGAGFATMLWLISVGLILGVVRQVRWLIDRHRYARWDSDFDALVHGNGSRKSDH